MYFYFSPGICVIVRYKLKVKWLKCRKLVTEKYTIYNSGEKIYILLELILIALMPYPFFAGLKFLNYIMNFFIYS